MARAAKSGVTGQKISDAAVTARTGRSWSEWFRILDAAGAQDMSHKEIASFLYEKKKVPGWWNQMVANCYEQQRGLRQKHQTPTGYYEISVSKVIEAPTSTLYKSWKDEKVRESWLPQQAIVIRKATPNRSLRITWSDRKTSLSVDFYEKGQSKGQVVVQHLKLKDPSAAEKMKKYWIKMLAKLKSELEG